MKRIWMLCCAVLLISQTVAFARQMPTEEIGIGGLRLGCTAGYVKSLYGEPQKVERDAAQVLYYTYTSPSLLRVTFYGKGIAADDDCMCIHILAEDDSISTPSGFTVGMPYQSVVDMYGEIPEMPKGRLDSNTGKLYLYGSYAKLEFEVDNDGLIKRIVLYGHE